jgi:aminomethyltransferase
LFPMDLFMRDGQLRQTLLLREDGTPLADATLCNDDDAWLVLAVGAPRDMLLEHVRTMATPLGATVVDLMADHALLSLDGPFAWELIAKLEGEGIIGFPYLSFYRPRPGWLFFRAGKTGEFGYDLLVPAPEAPELVARILAAGRSLDLAVVGVEALRHCALENWFFDIHREGLGGLTPVELGLQWRTSTRKDYLGASALRARRSEARGRIIAIRSAATLAPGAVLLAADREVGRVLHGERSLSLGDWPGLAHSGLGFRCAARGSSEGLALCSVSAPFVDNLSLYVNPQKHCYAERETIGFPGPERRP